MHFLRAGFGGLMVSLGLIVFRAASVLAQDYSCGTYGAGDYGVGDCQTAASGGIAGTGLNVWLVRALAILLIVLAAYVVWRTARKKKS